MLSYAHCIREDPVRRGLLYLGTENAIYVSFDDGENWQPLQTNLPHAPVYWIAVQEHFNDLVIATYGRGFWILDDITPLQQLTPQVLGSRRAPLPAAAGVPLPRDHAGRIGRERSDHRGRTRPTARRSTTSSKAPPAGDVTRRRFSNAQNQVVRTLTAPKAAGLNRVYWDLRDEPTTEVRLRTSPLYAPDVRVGPDGTRSGRRRPPVDPACRPARYTVRLNAGGKQLTQKLEVRKDPNSGGTDADIREQMKMLTELRRDVDAAAEVVNQIELVRGQIHALGQVLDGAGDHAAGRGARSQARRARAEPDRAARDRPRPGRRALRRRSCWASSAIWPTASPAPTSGRRISSSKCRKCSRSGFASTRRTLDALMGKDLKALNELMRGRGIANIVVRPPGSSQ